MRFLEGFAPAPRRGAPEGHLHLAFAAEGDWRAVGVCVRRPADAVLVEARGEGDLAGARDQVARILSLDVDGTGFAAVGARDPVVADLQARLPGLRPVTFPSAYEAAAWALLSHRVRMAQAAAVRARMTAELGEAVEVDGERLTAFPGPERLAALDGFPGLFGRKAEYLRALGEAALAGALDSARLRALPREEALAELRELPGVGPFSAELILLRGAGDPDGLPAHEPRVARAVGARYGLGGPASPGDLARIAEAWRPYRTWVSVLLRADEAGEDAPEGRRAAESRRYLRGR